MFLLQHFSIIVIWFFLNVITYNLGLVLFTTKLNSSTTHSTLRCWLKALYNYYRNLFISYRETFQFNSLRKNKTWGKLKRQINTKHTLGEMKITRTTIQLLILQLHFVISTHQAWVSQSCFIWKTKLKMVKFSRVGNEMVCARLLFSLGNLFKFNKLLRSNYKVLKKKNCSRETILIFLAYLFPKLFGIKNYWE